jgi:hypothetical protein
MPSPAMTPNRTSPATTSELVTAAHLDRKALIYVRQSTMQQVQSNQESLRLQYALEQRALTLGWRADDIDIIDADLGLTGAAASHRAGFGGGGHPGDARPGGDHPLVRGDAALAELLRLVPLARRLRIQRLPHRG